MFPDYLLNTEIQYFITKNIFLIVWERLKKYDHADNRRRLWK